MRGRMIGAVKSLIKNALPSNVYERVMAVRSRNHQLTLLRREGMVDATRKYIDLWGSVVRYGPFAGMIYPPESALLRVAIPKLLGTYERHLYGKGRKQRTVPLWRSTASLLRKWKQRLEKHADDDLLFPSRGGTAMSRSNAAQRLTLAAEAAAADHPRLRSIRVSPHIIRHTTAMHLLQSGVDITVIALWLGHENPSTTHMYVEADLSMKDRALQRLRPTDAQRPRYRPADQLMQFLSAL